MHLNNLISELVTILIHWSNMRILLVGLGYPYNLILLLDNIIALDKMPLKNEIYDSWQDTSITTNKKTMKDKSITVHLYFTFLQIMEYYKWKGTST